MFAFPEFVIVTSLFSLLLTRTLPKFKLVALAVNLIDCSTPVPLKSTVTGDSLASVLIETSPVSARASIGLKAMLKFMLEPAASFVGVFRPDKLNPAPLIWAPKIFSSDVPVFDTFIVCVASVLTVTLPKLAADGVRVTVPVPFLEPPTEPQPVSDSPTDNIATRIARLRTKRRIPTLETTFLGTHKPP